MPDAADALIERPEAVIATALDLGLQSWRTVPDAAQKFREAADALAALTREREENERARVLDAAEVRDRFAALTRERDEALLDVQAERETVAAWARKVEAAEAALAEAREALGAILDELGVPGDEYPAPVTNAYAIARAALTGEAT